MARKIAPRLRNGSRREPFGHGLPHVVRMWVRAEAERRNMSESLWWESVALKEFSQRHRRVISNLYKRHETDEE